MAAPRSLRSEDVPVVGTQKEDEATQPPTSASNATVRRRRSMVISDRKARSADVGVSGLYEVISEADLAFSPDGRAEAVTVFQGRIREEVVYGICLPGIIIFYNYFFYNDSIINYFICLIYLYLYVRLLYILSKKYRELLD